MANVLDEIRRAVHGQGAVQRSDPVAKESYHADVNRREPVYEPEATVEYDLDAQRVRFPTPDTHGTDKVEPPAQNDAGYRIAYPQRKEVVVGRFKRSANGLTDGTGNATVEFANVVPTNQTWIIDRVCARVAGAGAGTCILYEGSVANDDGMLAIIPLGAGNAAQIDGNPIEVSAGTRLFAQFVNAGAGLTATVRVFYRLVEYVPGRAEESTP